MSFIRDNKWFLALKILAGIFQAPATGRVFYVLFKDSGRGDLEAYFSAFMAILLIDALFLAVLYLLESPELDSIQKIPWVLVGVGLLVATFLIGYIDEGWMAWMPRTGFFGLVFADLFGWATEYYVFRNSREQQELRLRDKQVLARKKRNMKAWKEASQKLYPLVVERQKRMEMTAQNLIFDEQDQPEIDEVADPIDEMIPVEIEEGIYQINSHYGWYDPIKDRIFDKTLNEKPYTLTGARRARIRQLKNA